MAVAAITKPLDRWDLIADRELGVPELGWAIAEANPELIGYLVLPAGITLIVPDLATLRRPLTAANPAREDDGEFLPLVADDSPAPIPTGGGVSGDYVPLSAIGVTVAPLFNNLVPSGNLPAPPTLASLGGMSAEAINEALALKVDLSTYNTALALKVDLSTYNTGLASKADAAAVSIALGLKADASAVATALGLKLDTATFNAAIALKLDISAFNTAIALKADISAVNTALGLKLDTATRNAAGGVAGLDTNSLILTTQIPGSIQFLQSARVVSPSTFDYNALTAGHGAVKWIDGNVTTTNPPAVGWAGFLMQFDALNGILAGYKHQTAAKGDGRVADRSQSAGVWSPWNERAYLNGAQPFTTIQDFNAAARFKGGGTPAVTISLTQEGVDASGNPRVWLVNANATTGNRLKSITVASNGNVQITHHADDGTAGNILEHTASGNILTNGTVRPGSGNTAFTGAQFVPGSTYFRTDLLGDSGAGCATYSDGSVWRRVGDGTLITESARLRKSFTGTTPAAASFNFAHGLTLSKIKGVEILIAGFPPGYTTALYGGSAEYQYFITATDFYVVATTNKTAISSAAYTITLIYNP